MGVLCILATLTRSLCSMRYVVIFLMCLPFCSFSQEKTAFDYVDPLIGTQRMGHVYPGATVPFGMVQLSPDTDTIPYEVNGKYNPDVYRYCAGYQYDDKLLSDLAIPILVVQGTPIWATFSLCHLKVNST